MRSEAATAGFYESTGWNRAYPRLQLYTIAELMTGKSIECPPPSRSFKRAPKAKNNNLSDPTLF